MKEKYVAILEELMPTSTLLVAVSKKNSEQKIMELYALGQRDFGENHVQELITKAKNLPKDIRWHMIGHLQKNKVRQVLPFVHMIQSVDSAELLILLQEECLRINKTLPILLEIKIAKEENKYGFTKEEIMKMFEANDATQFPNLQFKGVMGMASFTEDTNLIRQEFHLLKQTFHELKQKQFSSTSSFKDISMGMSGDYKLAIAEGSTIVRIGSLLFGSR